MTTEQHMVLTFLAAMFMNVVFISLIIVICR